MNNIHTTTNEKYVLRQRHIFKTIRHGFFLKINDMFILL